MIKGYIKKISLLLMVSVLTLSIIPTSVKAETLKDYENLLKKYQKEQANIDNQMGENNKLTKEAEQEIESIKKSLTKMSQEIEQMHIDIIDYNNEIREKTLQTKELFEYLQMTRSENVMLEYAFGAENITDLIYRIAIVKQITEFNETKINELKDMIEYNKKREIELDNKEKEMNKRQQELSEKITKLTKQNASLNENHVSAQKQIDIYKDQIAAYRAAGCTSNMVIGVDCFNTNSVAGWFRPIQSGYVTSEFGYRWGSLHRAVDVSNNNPYNTKIYPVAKGIVTSVYKDYYGALTVIIEHKTANGKYYSSLYTHLSSYSSNARVGKTVGPNDFIGYMGDTGYAYGPHLHLEIAPCRAMNSADKNCGTWNKYTAFVKKQYDSGKFKGPRDLIYFPKPYVKFNSR